MMGPRDPAALPRYTSLISCIAGVGGVLLVEINKKKVCGGGKGSHFSLCVASIFISESESENEGERKRYIYKERDCANVNVIAYLF